MADIDLANVYATHRQGLFTLALSITRCAAVAEDAVHTAFGRLCASPTRGVADPVAYVFAAVRRAAIDQHRRQRSRSAAVERLFALDSPRHAASASDDVIAAERALDVAEALEALPDDAREVVVLRVYAGLSFAQIAEVLSEPAPTVSARYHRTLEKLRGRLRKLVRE